jgi:leucyl aminopeptidase
MDNNLISFSYDKKNIFNFKLAFKNEFLDKFIFLKKDQEIVYVSEIKTFLFFLENKTDFDFDIFEKKLKQFIKSNNYSFDIDISSFSVFFDFKKCCEIIIENIFLNSHKKISYKTKTDKKSDQSLNLNFNFLIKNENEELIIKNIIQEKKIVVKVINMVCDFQDMPPNFLYPEVFCQEIIKKYQSNKNLEIKILDIKAIKETNMNLLLSVNEGSHPDHQAKILVIKYQGKKSDKDYTALIGKGITFDTGGISLKPSSSMKDMKFDMSGAAIASGAIFAAAELNLKVNIVSVSSLTENKIGSRATLVESVIKSMSGKTVEINNTDAEGRLVMADAITYAIKNFNIKQIITVATLTGAILVALGKEITGVFSNNDSFYKLIWEASKKAKEKIWRMPIDKCHSEAIKSSQVADLSNISKEYWAGSSTAAAFIQEFCENLPFIHLDIAGTAYKNSRGTAVIVKTLIELFKLEK